MRYLAGDLWPALDVTTWIENCLRFEFQILHSFCDVSIFEIATGS